jgi:hypothetical protein
MILLERKRSINAKTLDCEINGFRNLCACAALISFMTSDFRYICKIRVITDSIHFDSFAIEMYGN